MTAKMPNEQVPGVFRRRFGDVVVTALLDGYVQFAPEFLLNCEPGELASLSRRAFGPDRPYAAISAYLVQAPDVTVLIDAGGGPLMANPNANKLMGNLQAAGVSPADIDMVLLTHLHTDHFGGTVDADGKAAFPNAELVYPHLEADWWLNTARAEAAPEDQKQRYALVSRTVDAYAGRARTIESGDLPGFITPILLAGHTPGHTGYLIGAAPDQVLIWGDVFHVPALQSQRPEIGIRFDIDPALAVETRKAILARVADERLLVAGMHMDFPGFAYIERRESGYGLVWSNWAPVI